MTDDMLEFFDSMAGPEPVGDFVLTPALIRLVRRMSFYRYKGWPVANSVRPFGNSDISGDVAAVLGLRIGWRQGEPDWTKAEADAINRAANATTDALQVVLDTGGFVPGAYRRGPQSLYRWVLVARTPQDQLDAEIRADLSRLVDAYQPFHADCHSQEVRHGSDFSVAAAMGCQMAEDMRQIGLAETSLRATMVAFLAGASTPECVSAGLDPAW